MLIFRSVLLTLALAAAQAYFPTLHALRRASLNLASDGRGLTLHVVNESKDGKNYLDPTNPTDGRPGLRSSTGSKGKSKGNKMYNKKSKGAISSKEGNSARTLPESQGEPRGRVQQLQYQQRTERLYDSLAFVSNAGQFLQKLRVRVERASLEFDPRERQALSQAIGMYIGQMNARQTASLVSYLGTFSSSNTNWKHSEDGAVAPNTEFSSSRMANQTGDLKRQVLKVAPQLSGSDMAAIIVGLARMNFDWSRTFGTRGTNPFITRLESLLGGGSSGSSGSSSSSSSSSSDEQPDGSGGMSFVSINAQSKKAKQQNTHSISAAELGDVIWGMGTMNAKRSQLPASLNRNLLASFDDKWFAFNGFSLSSALWAFAKMGITWRTLAAPTREQLPARLLELGAKMSPQQSSKVLWALGTLGAKLGSQTEGIGKDVLLLHLGSVASKKRSQTGRGVSASQALIGVAKMGAPWSSFDKATKEKVLDLLSRVCSSGNSRGITNAFWAMGTLGVTAWVDVNQRDVSKDMDYNRDLLTLPEATRELMLESGMKAAETATSWAACNLVWGLSKMKFEWSRLDSTFRTRLMEALVSLQDDMNCVDICILLWSLGALNCPLDTVPASFRSALLGILERNLDRIEAEELSKAIWGLSCCSIAWNDLTPEIRWKLNVALRRVGDDMSPQGVANCAYGIAIIAFDYASPGEASFRGVHETLLSLIVRNKLDIFARRDGMEAYRKVRAEANRRRNSRISSQRIDSSSRPVVSGKVPEAPPEALEEESTLLSSSEDMDIALGDLEGMPVYVQDIDTDKILRLSRDDESKLTDQQRQQQQEYEQLRIFAHYLASMKFVTDTNRIPPELLAPTALGKDYGKGSRLQNRVLGGLKRGFEGQTTVGGQEVSVEVLDGGIALGDQHMASFSTLFNSGPQRFGLQLEASSFEGVFPVDFSMVSADSKEVVALIEVNGPTHYRVDGRLKRKDMLKQAMYMKRHPDATYHRVRYNDANKLGSDVIGEEVAAVIVGDMKDRSPVSRALRRTQQSLQDFFSWGLRNEQPDSERSPDGRG